MVDVHFSVDNLNGSSSPERKNCNKKWSFEEQSPSVSSFHSTKLALWSHLPLTHWNADTLPCFYSKNVVFQNLCTCFCMQTGLEGFTVKCIHSITSLSSLFKCNLFQGLSLTALSRTTCQPLSLYTLTVLSLQHLP